MEILPGLGQEKTSVKVMNILLLIIAPFTPVIFISMIYAIATIAAPYW